MTETRLKTKTGRRWHLLSMLFLMLGFMLSATQLDAIADHAISGQVVDSNGTPLAGVNVIIKDTNVGIVTDVNGKFTIRVRDNSKQVTLSFSFLGYATIEKQVTVGITGPQGHIGRQLHHDRRGDSHRIWYPDRVNRHIGHYLR